MALKLRRIIINYSNNVMGMRAEKKTVKWKVRFNYGDREGLTLV